jgi:TolA-binding protein
MEKQRFGLRNLIGVAIIIFGVVLGWNGLTVAQGSTTQLEYRMSRLESQVSQLAGQINSLRYQNSGTTVIQVEPDATSSAPQPNNRFLSGDPMFDRLATLVIETKQDVQELQQQIADLKAQVEDKK